MVVSEYRCFMFVSSVHVIVLSVVLCNICNLFVFEMLGDQIVLAYSNIGSVIALYVTSSVSFFSPNAL